MKTNLPNSSPASDGAAAVATTKRRILLVDDHPITCRGVAALIDQEFDLQVCGQADSAPKALELLQKLEPDLAVVDVALKGTSGIEFVKNARAMRPKLLVLMMSMFDERIYAERALRAGAQGYIMKHEASERIVPAIRRVLEGRIFLSTALKEKLLHRFVAHKPQDEIEDSVETLSDREMEVFELIGEGFTTREIAERLNLSVKTIDSYREHLKVKLRIERGTDLLRHAIQWAKTRHLV